MKEFFFSKTYISPWKAAEQEQAEEEEEEKMKSGGLEPTVTVSCKSNILNPQRTRPLGHAGWWNMLGILTT